MIGGPQASKRFASAMKTILSVACCEIQKRIEEHGGSFRRDVLSLEHRDLSHPFPIGHFRFHGNCFHNSTLRTQKIVLPGLPSGFSPSIEARLTNMYSARSPAVALFQLGIPAESGATRYG